MDELKFNCTMCGLCCSNVKSAIEKGKKTYGKDPLNPIAKELVEFPYAYDASGKCENLLPDNTCRVYDHRPLICNVDKLYEKFVSKNMDKKAYYAMQERGCRTLQNNAENKLKNIETAL